MTSPSRCIPFLLAIILSTAGATSFAQATKPAIPTLAPSTPEALAKAPKLTPFGIELNSEKSCARMKAKFKELSPGFKPDPDDVGFYLKSEKIFPGSASIMTVCTPDKKMKYIRIQLLESSGPIGDVLAAVGEKYPFEKIEIGTDGATEFHSFKAKDGSVKVNAAKTDPGWFITYSVFTDEDKAEQKREEAEKKATIKRAL